MSRPPIPASVLYALEAGGHDNVTVALVPVLPGRPGVPVVGP